MIKCNRCGNSKKFFEVHIGGERWHQWSQEPNGRFVFDGSDYDKVHDTIFKCGKCSADISNQYRRFLQALCMPYIEE